MTPCTCTPSLYSCGCGELHAVEITGTPWHHEWRHWAPWCLRRSECLKCQGTGWSAGVCGEEVCTKCGGSGRIRPAPAFDGAA